MSFTFNGYLLTDLTANQFFFSLNGNLVFVKAVEFPSCYYIPAITVFLAVINNNTSLLIND